MVSPVRLIRGSWSHGHAEVFAHSIKINMQIFNPHKYNAILASSVLCGTCVVGNFE